MNPTARTDPRNVIVLKRSMAAGYSGVEHIPNTIMLFGDAKKSLEALVAEVKVKVKVKVV